MAWDNTYHVCALAGYEVNCQGRLELHHIISYGMVQGNKEIRKLLRTNPPELCTWLCEKHHQRNGRDRKARRVMLKQKIDEFGYEWMEFTIDNLPWKVDLEERKLRRMLA